MDLDQQPSQRSAVKCLIWDLDGTLWDGILLEDDGVQLRPNVLAILQTLDERGILHSIASTNDQSRAMAQLSEFGLTDYFLYPRINWGSKVSSIRDVAASLNISLDAIAFIDDQPFEREAVKFSLPEVLCLDATELDRLTEMAELSPAVITEDSKDRRKMYLAEIKRKEAEETFAGPAEDYLATLEMVFELSIAEEADLERAEELTNRTHQLNSTGRTYSIDELNEFRRSDKHKLLIGALTDKFGSYGKVALALIECDQPVWTIKLLLVSCRVMSRGIGTVVLTCIMELAKQHRVRLLGEFVANDKNRIMYVTYKFAGFKETQRSGNDIILENDLRHIQQYPRYLKFIKAF
jgi:FkbH-like protein